MRLEFKFMSRLSEFQANGQFLQDAIAYVFFHGKSNGFFADIGARDGIGDSNTYALEQLGWRGFCVEPRKDFYSRLQSNRHCNAYNFALSNEKKDGVPFIISYTPERQGWSGIIPTMPASFLAEIEKYGNTERTIIPVTTFNNIMNNYPDVTHIDFLSIDCECHELNVLHGIDFNKYSFGLITIEKHNPESLIKFLQTAGNGYKCIMETNSDLLFIPIDDTQ
jgi:FkbM family methyltransferase